MPKRYSYATLKALKVKLTPRQQEVVHFAVASLPNLQAPILGGVAVHEYSAHIVGKGIEWSLKHRYMHKRAEAVARRVLAKIDYVRT